MTTLRCNVDAVSLATIVIADIDPISGHKVHSIDNMSQIGTSWLYPTSIEVTQDIGSVTASAIGSLIAGRDVLGPIIATTTGSLSPGITLIRANSGAIRGNISAAGERIRFIEADSVGTSTTPITISAMDGIQQIFGTTAIYANITANQSGSGNFQRLRTPVFVGSLTASNLAVIDGSGQTGITIQSSGALDANLTITQNVSVPITAGSFPSGRTINIGNVISSANTVSFSSGTIAGTINVGTIQGTISAGSLTGRINASSNLGSSGSITLSSSVAPSGVIRLGSSLLGTITLPTNGLQGQIIANGSNGSGVWTGDVTIGSTTISHTSGVYSTLPAALGGGAIGLAPFRMHQEACTPPNGQINTPGDILENSSFNSESDVPVIITHYGPIVRSNTLMPWTDCVEIQCRPINAPSGTECDWVTVTPAFVVRGPGDSGWTDPRSIGISRAPGMYPKVGTYRVALKTNRIRCVDVTGAPSVVWPETCDESEEPAFAYTFRIEPDCDNDLIGDFEDGSVNCSVNPCHVDMNDDGTVDVPDIFAFLSFWFAQHARADFDKSGTIEVADIFAYLSAWFATSDQNCPG